MSAKDEKAEKPEPYNFFRVRVGLDGYQIRGVGSGTAVAKILDSRSAVQVIASGAARVAASPESYLKFAEGVFLPCHRDGSTDYRDLYR